jgi:hypothetical protein
MTALCQGCKKKLPVLNLFDVIWKGFIPLLDFPNKIYRSIPEESVYGE